MIDANQIFRERAVADTLFVRVAKCGEYSAAELERGVHRPMFEAGKLRRRYSADGVHHIVGLAVHAAVCTKSLDIRMAQTREDLLFAGEELAKGAVVANVRA